VVRKFAAFCGTGGLEEAFFGIFVPTLVLEGVSCKHIFRQPATIIKNVTV
jgi:hypothetical protein